MGIESDQTVYEYLSRVGDVAQRRQMTASDRARLVSRLREEIDGRRAKSADSPAAVRRILGRLGSPDEVVSAASGGRDDGPRTRGPGPAAPPEGAGGPAGRTSAAGGVGRRARVFAGRPTAGDLPEPPARAEGTPAAGASTTPVGPGLVSGAARAGGSGEADPPRVTAGAGPPPGGVPPAGSAPGDLVEERDWWRVRHRAPEVGEGVPGFVGGVRIPRPYRWEGAGDPVPGGGEPGPVPESGSRAVPGPGPGGGAAAGEAPGPPSTARRARALWSGIGGRSPFLLCAAALLFVGAALGSLVPLALGWSVVLLSRRLTPAQIKWAVLGVPGAVAAAAGLWLWGRADGRWGDPVASGELGVVVSEAWPWVLRGAAVASALYLVWRARRAG
ncbi:hypothetical protein AAH978_15155 [Streptomyces sp. ZYX-F-203]